MFWFTYSAAQKNNSWALLDIRLSRQILFCIVQRNAGNILFRQSSIWQIASFCSKSSLHFHTKCQFDNGFILNEWSMNVVKKQAILFFTTISLFFTIERATLSRLLNDNQLTNVIIVQTVQTKQQHCQNHMKAMKK